MKAIFILTNTAINLLELPQFERHFSFHFAYETARGFLHLVDVNDTREISHHNVTNASTTITNHLRLINTRIV